MVILWCSVLSVLLGNTFPALFPHRTLLLNQHSSVIGACKCDVSTQSDPTLTHQPFQTVVSTNTCPCTHAVELSQHREELMDMKIRMKNQLKILYNLFSNAPSLELVVNTSSPCSYPTAPNTHNKEGSYASAAPLTFRATTDTNPLKCNPLTRISILHPLPPQ